MVKLAVAALTVLGCSSLASAFLSSPSALPLRLKSDTSRCTRAAAVSMVADHSVSRRQAMAGIIGGAALFVGAEGANAKGVGEGGLPPGVAEFQRVLLSKKQVRAVHGHLALDKGSTLMA